MNGLFFVRQRPFKSASPFFYKKNKTTGLTASENVELDGYEEIDDQLSYLNRIIHAPHEKYKTEQYEH